MFRKIIIVLVIFFGAITFAQSETSWIKKKDKSEKVEKVEKEKKKDSSWIKKKKVKENKKKLKEKVKDSKSWITKKSKEKVQDIKEKLKKHKTIENLPKADVYFVAEIIPNDENQKAEYFYGFIKNNKQSEKFNFEGKQSYKIGEGFAYFENKKNRCSLDVEFVPTRSRLATDIIFDCGNKKMMESFSYLMAFKDKNNFGEGKGTHWNGNDIKLEFYGTKELVNTHLAFFKKERKMLIQQAHSPENQYEDGELKISPHGKYYALLIGNSKYTNPNWASLKSPVNDVKEISKILKKNYKFEKVITVLNATRDEMYDAFDQLSEITTDKDYVLIYYAGHGDTKQDQAYWVPVNGSKKIRDWVNIKDISVYVESMSAQHLVLMIDSCYTGSAFKGTNQIDKNKNTNLSRLVTKLLESRARYVLSSGGNEPVIDESGGKHSLFAKSFIRSLNDVGFINMQQIAYNVAVAHSGLDQRPYFYSPEKWDNAGGDFIFIPKKNLK